MAGYKWELFIGMNGKMKVFTFMAMEDIRVFESNIKPFFNHIAKKHGFPAKEQHLTSTWPSSQSWPALACVTESY